MSLLTTVKSLCTPTVVKAAVTACCAVGAACCLGGSSHDLTPPAPPPAVSCVDPSKNAVWSCRNEIGQTFYSNSAASCAQYYPDCESKAIIPNNCVDPNFQLAHSCDTATATASASATHTATASSTATATSIFPSMPGRSCSIDTFHQPTASAKDGGGNGGTCYDKLDVLFVVDHSPSMRDHWHDFAGNLDRFLGELPKGEDVRFGVLLGDVGRWGGHLYAPFGSAYLDGQKLSSAQVIAQLEKMFDAAQTVKDEGRGHAGLYSLHRAVTRFAAENQSRGFFRADAGLTVIFMSDHADLGFDLPGDHRWCGDDDRCEHVKRIFYRDRGIDADACFRALKQLKGEHPLVAHAFVNDGDKDFFARFGRHACYDEMIGYGYRDLAHRCGGQVYEIHKDKGTGLGQCGQSTGSGLALQHDFTLSHPATEVDPATIVSAVDNAIVNGTYTASSDSVYLANAGAAGSTIQIQYCAPVVTSIPAWSLVDFAGTPSQTAVALSWSTSPVNTSGKVMWGLSATSLTSEADDANNTASHAVTVSGLAPNTTYYFQATSVDSAGKSQTSSVIAVTTLPQWTLANVSAQAAITTASVLWQTPSYPTAGYVNWGLAAGALTNQIQASGVSASQSVALSGLAPATTYYYQVVASDAFGQTQSSGVLSFTTEANWTITGFAGTPAQTAVALTWQTAAQATAGSVLWGTSPNALTNQVAEGAGDVTSHSVMVSGLEPGTTYYFEAVAVDPSGIQQTAGPIAVETSVNWAISDLVGTSTDASVTISWATNGMNTSGLVNWGLSATLGASQADTVNGQSHSVTVSGLAPSTTYYFQVSSTDGEGNEQSSAVITVATQAVPLPVWSITDLAGSSTTSSVTISWDTTQYSTSGVALWGSSPSALGSQVSDSVTGTAHSVTIDGLNPGTTYYFQAVSSDNDGQTQSSSVIAVATLAVTPPPTNTETATATATTSNTSTVTSTSSASSTSTDTGTTTEPANWTITSFDGTTTANSADLIWQTNGAATTGTVLVGLSATDLTLTSVPVTTAAQTQTAVVSGLSPGTTYYFQVIATDSFGNSQQSAVIAKTTKAQ